MITQKNMADMECSNDLLKNELNTLLSLLDSAKDKLASQYTIDTVDGVGRRRKEWLYADLKVKVGKYYVYISRVNDNQIDIRLVCYQPIKKGDFVADFWGQNAAEGWLNCKEIVCLEDIVKATTSKLRELEPVQAIDKVGIH